MAIGLKKRSYSIVPLRTRGAVAEQGFWIWHGLAVCVLLGMISGIASAEPLKLPPLPAQYYRLMAAGVQQLEQHMDEQPGADLVALENGPGWKHLPYSILAAATLYAKRNPANHHYHDPKMLAEAIKLGDFFADQNEKGIFTPRLDSDWDTYMWVEAYRQLLPELGKERAERWKKAIIENVSPFYPEAKMRIDFPWYNSPYIGTSPNHYAQWASLMLVAGHVFGNKDWVELGSQILHRFATVEQTSDGYWGEHSRQGPTTGYDYITSTQIGLYWEYSHDPAALEAMRRNLNFHKYFTHLDGTPVEIINGRNRYNGVEAWGQFGFTHFPDGRRYDEFLTSFYKEGHLSMDELGRLAQDALYYHEGPTAPTPQEMDNFSHRLSIPAGIHKTGPWEVCLSGVIETTAPTSQFYLDRQSNVSVLNQKLGLIISGANSKRQPELATFTEKIDGQTYYMPMSSRLQMGKDQDRISVSFNSFFADLYVPTPAGNSVTLRFEITGKYNPPQEADLNLQLVLKPGETLETGAGRTFTVGEDKIDLGPDEIGGWIKHNGWTLKVDPTAHLTWPIYPYNPYANAPEKTLDHAVARLTVPLQLKGEHGGIRPHQQTITFTLTAD